MAHYTLATDISNLRLLPRFVRLRHFNGYLVAYEVLGYWHYLEQNRSFTYRSQTALFNDVFIFVVEKEYWLQNII